jgi:peptide-methionine (S)-S-oxide reductase
VNRQTNVTIRACPGRSGAAFDLRAGGSSHGLNAVGFRDVVVLAATTLLLITNMTSALAQSPATSRTANALATLGGGCFWCVEAVFERVPGIRAVVSGYAGGQTVNPTYQAVCDGSTGHAEVVQIQFDPEVISYSEILDLFWQAHDPTTPNRQGADVGTQYRSIILYHNTAQKEQAEASKKKAATALGQPVVTEIVALEQFYAAEEYHQDYFRKNPKAPYCVAVINPKLKKLEKQKSRQP